MLFGFFCSNSVRGRSESDCELNVNVKQALESVDTLPDRHKSLQMPLAPLPIVKKLSATAKKAHLMMSDEIHDYSEIYTPSAEDTNKVVLEDNRGEAVSSSMSADSSRSLETAQVVLPQSKPPAPPLHRYPSWEDRIYQVACQGMKDATGGDLIDSKNNNSGENGLKGSSSTSSRAGFGADINVPVYATVKGVSIFPKFAIFKHRAGFCSKQQN